MKKTKLSGGLRKNKLKTKNIKPFFSIIMVVLNNEKFIQKSIDSVINQSFKSYELIIIDGGSTDNTVKILKKIILKLIFGYLKKIKVYMTL